MCSKASNYFKPRMRGVTLVELVVVLTLIAIIASVSAIAVRDPIRAYIDTTRRAELTDMADTALRRVSRDLQRALPNSARVAGANPVFLEFLLTRTGGRYRAQGDGAGGDLLDLGTPDVTFDSLGALSNLPGQRPVVGDIAVVYNLFATGNEANAYTFDQANCTAATPFHINCNTARITGVADIANGTRLTIENRQFPLASPGNRFHVVEGPVTYICTPGPVNAAGDGTGTLVRVSNYTIRLAGPDGVFNGAPVAAVLARFVTACNIQFDPLVLRQSLGLVSMRLDVTRANEVVRLYHEVHVSNIP